MKCNLLAVLGLAALVFAWGLSANARPDRSAEDGQPAVNEPTADDVDIVALKPARVFDGVTADVHENWVVIIRSSKIDSAGPADKVAVPAGARIISLPKATLLPGHSRDIMKSSRSNSLMR